jgi:flagellar biosynthesis chaperone FliJ
MTTEIRIQKAESREFRLEKAEISKEDTEQEIKLLEKTYNEIQALLDKITPSTTAHQELKIFLKKLEKEIEDNNNILDEIKQSIDYIRGH